MTVPEDLLAGYAISTLGALILWLGVLLFAVWDYGAVEEGTLLERQSAARHVLTVLVVGCVLAMFWPLVVVGYALHALFIYVRDAFFLDTTHEEGSDA